MDIPGYTIDRLIAEGGTASVYLALQQSLGRTVALKVLDKLDNAEQSARFLAEGELIASLNHRSINTLYDVGRVGDRHYLAMEFLEGGSLADRIAKGMRLTAALDVLESMAACLTFLHEKGIVHRDVKPSNILFHADGTPKLTDFGIAKQLGRDQQLTLDGTALGSPYYLSPEQATNQPLDGRSDIYSLGVVFYEMLTGRKPFSEDSHVQTIVAHINQPVPKLPDGRATYQPLLERMMAKEPQERFGSAAELLGFIRGTRLANPDRPPAFWQTPAFALGSVSLLVIGLLVAFMSWPTRPPIATLVNVAEPPASTPTLVINSPLTSPQPIMPAAPEPVTASVVVNVEPPALPMAPPIDPIEAWLASAETAYQQNRLTVPNAESALSYYNRVLAEQPGHAEAKAGITRIVQRYYGMARRAVDRDETAKAQRLITRGLNIDPQHTALLELATELSQQTVVAAPSKEPDPVEKAVDNVKSWWERNFN